MRSTPAARSLGVRAPIGAVATADLAEKLQVVHLNHGVPFDEQAVKDHVRDQLAGYKTPKAIHPTEKPLRASNGKADYATAKAIAERLTVAS